jgi:ATP adenylyltransferase
MNPVFKPGTLWNRIKETTEQALQCGTLHPIPTEYEYVEEQGIQFFVRILANLTRKEKAKKEQERQSITTGKDVNPFLPPERELIVADISDTHLCILNKFNVVEYHLLIITRLFEDQDELLTFEDIEALWKCMIEFDSLGFYNAGKIAGASQRHKHLQIVPLPLAYKGPRIPIEPLLKSMTFNGLIGTTSKLPFVHAFVGLEPGKMNSPDKAAHTLYTYYHAMLAAVGLKEKDRQPPLYNLLVTPQWMFIVPRTLEFFESVSINSLGFAGALLVRDDNQMKILKNHGPMKFLKSVAVPI